MGLSLPKILRPLCGRPLIFWILDTLKQCGRGDIIMVTGYKAKLTEKSVNDAGYKEIKFVKQDKLLGTAHAVGVGLSVVPEMAEDVLVLFGDDSALYRPATLDNFIKFHQENHAKATVLTVISDVPTSLGGLRKDDLGRIAGVMSKQEMREKGINRHLETRWIKEILKKIPRNEVSGEYLLPGFIKIVIAFDKLAVFGYIDWYDIVFIFIQIVHHLKPSNDRHLMFHRPTTIRLRY